MKKENSKQHLGAANAKESKGIPEKDTHPVLKNKHGLTEDGSKKSRELKRDEFEPWRRYHRGYEGL